MITDFNLFGLTHILSLLAAVVIGIIFIFLAMKYPTKIKNISIALAITIILIRSVRYGFDMYLGVFEIKDLISFHICHIDLILLIICLLKPNKEIFVFTFLIGIPTALAVALMPGRIHPEPGILRAIFFIMSHMMLVMASIYLLIAYKFEITIKKLSTYYAISAWGIVLCYLYDVFSGANFMYLTAAPTGSVLESLFNYFGPVWYVFSIYVILSCLLTIIFLIYKILNRKN